LLKLEKKVRRNKQSSSSSSMGHEKKRGETD
jgi:hypothetical protein